MSEIVGVLAVPATGAYYYTDLAALQDTPVPLADQYTAEPTTPGFRRIREVADAVSVGLILNVSASTAPHPDAFRIVWGDCVSVAYAGIGGREPVFRAADGLSTIRRQIAPFLEGRKISSFRDLAVRIDSLTETVEMVVPEQRARGEHEQAPSPEPSRRDLLTAPFRLLGASAPHAQSGQTEEASPAETPPAETVTTERLLHPAVRYGVSQALLKAAAVTKGRTMAEVIADEWDLPQPADPVPIHAQAGADRRKNADKMIIRRVESLPHGLVEDLPTQLGEDGDALIRYLRWLRTRLEELGGLHYNPTIHLDVHGAVGRMVDANLGRILGYLYRLESSVQPSTLRLESPLIMDGRTAQIETMRTLREYLQFRKMKLQIVADEWANTLDDIQAFVAAQAADMIHIKMPDLGSVHNSIEAVLACKKGNIGALLGGSCTETDLSARVTAHVALATQPDVVMAKPGMGVDEGITILQNEMARTLAAIKARNVQLS